MTRTLTAAATVTLLVALTVLALPAAGASEPIELGQVAVTDVSILPMDRDVVLRAQTVLITGGRITAIGPSDAVTVPASARVIDGSGRFLLPGLSDMHAHLRRKQGHLPPDYLRQGITLVRNMAGEESHLDFREAVRSGDLPGPLFYTTGQPLTSSDLFPSHRKVTSAAEGRAAVREHFEAGYDFIKVYSLLSKDTFDGIVAEADALGIPVVGHISDQVGLRHALAAGISSIEHLFSYFWELESADSELGGEWHPRRLFHAVEIDPDKLGAVAKMTADAGAWNCPTLWRKNNYLTFPPAKQAWETPALRALAEDNRKLLVKALHDAGAGLLTGTDNQAHIIHEELELFVEAGLTPYEALRASTVNAALYLEAIEDFGTVEVGRRANLLLLEANPIDDIRNTRGIVGVMMNGVWIAATESKATGSESPD
jgi:imidazolonepropionase-like amidohydrolase